MAGLAAAGTFGMLGAMMPPNHVSGSDTTFATKFSAAGNTEIALAKVAVTRSKNPKTVAFANKMIADHTKAGAQLTTIANKKGLSIESQPNPTDQAMVDKLKTVPPGQFDSVYRTDNVMGHATALGLLNTEINSGKDADLVKYAKMTKPTVTDHKMRANALPTT